MPNPPVIPGYEKLEPPIPPIGFAAASGFVPGFMVLPGNPPAPPIPPAIGVLNVVYAGMPYVKGFAPGVALKEFRGFAFGFPNPVAPAGFGGC